MFINLKWQKQKKLMHNYIFSHHSSFREIFKQEIIDQETNDTLRLLATITDTSVNEIYIFDTDTLYFLYVNKSAEANLGYSLDEMKYFTPVDIYTKISLNSFKNLLKPLYSSDNKFIKLQTRLQRKNFSFYNVQIIIKKILLPEREYFVAIITDITEQIIIQKQLKSLATRDCLTGIYNRHKANQIIDEEIIRQNRYNGTFTLMMFDIDYFKLVNDTYGHNIGDSVLQELSKLILKNKRQSDKFARWGGEEFIMVLPETTSKDSLIFAKKIRKIIADHSFEKVAQITVSIGICVFQENDIKEKLLQKVDEALYEAKNKGRNRVILKKR